MQFQYYIECFLLSNFLLIDVYYQIIFSKFIKFLLRIYTDNVIKYKQLYLFLSSNLRLLEFISNFYRIFIPI
jgi:hypothetical protein